MSLTLLLTLQAANVMPSDFDLGNVRPSISDRYALSAAACPRGANGDIVICGRRPSGGAYPLDAMALLFAPRPFVPEMGIGGNVRMRAYTEQGAMDRGVYSNRAMVGFKLSF
jgi:hypothetical protein